MDREQLQNLVLSMPHLVLYKLRSTNRNDMELELVLPNNKIGHPDLAKLFEEGEAQCHAAYMPFVIRDDTLGTFSEEITGFVVGSGYNGFDITILEIQSKLGEIRLTQDDKTLLSLPQVVELESDETELEEYE